MPNARKLSDTVSTRRSSWPAPPLLQEEIKPSTMVSVRYGTFIWPALHTTSCAFLKCLPLQQNLVRIGVALSTYLVNDTSRTLTCPVPAPLPWCALPDWVMPHDQVMMSIQS